jgi:hypothetical protein
LGDPWVSASFRQASGLPTKQRQGRIFPTPVSFNVTAFSKFLKKPDFCPWGLLDYAISSPTKKARIVCRPK